MEQQPGQNLLYGFLSMGVLIGGCGFVLMLAHPPGSAEFFLSACSGVMGLTLGIGALLVGRWMRRR